jgi:Ca2+-binding RTX toxin-like protein
MKIAFDIQIDAYHIQVCECVLGALPEETVMSSYEENYEDEYENDEEESSDGNDILIGSARDDEIEGSDGHDLLSGLAGDDELEGDDGNDTLYGGTGSDTLEGENGDDLLFGGVGADLFEVTPDGGNDTIGDFSVGEDILRIDVDDTSLTFADISALMGSDSNGDALIDFGGGNTVTLLGVSAEELTEASFRFKGSSLSGAVGDDVLSGTSNDDTISGGNGSDLVSGGAGADLIYGNILNDTLLGGDGDDTCFGGQSDDAIDGSDGDDVIYGNMSSDVLSGGAGDDTLFGGQGRDTLFGNDGNDWLLGNLGKDILSGGAGNDTLVGGNGDDLFVFADNSGADTVVDFTTTGTVDTLQIARGVNGSGVSGFSDLRDAIADNVDGNAVIDLGGGNAITLIGVRSTDLSANDFAFV